jgi:DNA-binding MarR family transcriptional regulator
VPISDLTLLGILYRGFTAKDQQLGRAEIGILLLLHDRERHGDADKPISYADIAKQLSYSRSAIPKTIKGLRENRLIVVSGLPGNAMTLRLAEPKRPTGIRRMRKLKLRGQPYPK